MFTATSLYLLGKEAWSINFELSFYSLAMAGTTLRVEIIIERSGGTVNTVRCAVRDKETGKLVLTGLHTTQRSRRGTFIDYEKAKL